MGSIGIFYFYGAEKGSTTKCQPLSITVMDKIKQINLVLKEYFTLNKSVRIVPAKDMMPYFILACIFPADHSNGLPMCALLGKQQAAN